MGVLSAPPPLVLPARLLTCSCSYSTRLHEDDVPQTTAGKSPGTASDSYLARGPEQVLVVGEGRIYVVHRTDGTVDDVPGGSLTDVALTLGHLEHETALETRTGDDPATARRVGGEPAPGSTGGASTSTAIASLDAEGATTYDLDTKWRVPTGSAVTPTTLALLTGSIADVLDLVQQLSTHSCRRPVRTRPITRGLIEKPTAITPKTGAPH